MDGTCAPVGLDDVMKKKATWQGDEVLFPMDANGTVTRRMTYAADDKTTAAILQQQQQSATLSVAADASATSLPPRKKDNRISWTSAAELKASLEKRRSLTKDEVDILRVLSQAQQEKDEFGAD